MASTTTPGTSAPRPSGGLDRDDTRSRLLAAATAVFAEKGYDRAGVAEIARRAGLTTGAIYSRFRGKADLLAAALVNDVPDELDLLFATHAFDGRVTDVLRTVGSHLVTRRTGQREGLLLEALVAARRDPEVAVEIRHAFEQRRTRLLQLVEDGQANGLVDESLDPHAIVHFAQAVGLGFLGYEAVGLPHPDPDAWDEVISRAVAAMAPDAASASSPPPHPTAMPTETPTEHEHDQKHDQK